MAENTTQNDSKAVPGLGARGSRKAPSAALGQRATLVRDQLTEAHDTRCQWEAVTEPTRRLARAADVDAAACVDHAARVSLHSPLVKDVERCGVRGYRVGAVAGQEKVKRARAKGANIPEQHSQA